MLINPTVAHLELLKNKDLPKVKMRLYLLKRSGVQSEHKHFPAPVILGESFFWPFGHIYVSAKRGSTFRSATVQVSVSPETSFIPHLKWSKRDLCTTG